MKKIFLLMAVCLLCAAASNAQNDAIARFFEKYANDERFTLVHVSPKMFQLLSKFDNNDPEWSSFKEVVSDLTGLRVLVADDSVMNGTQLYKEAIQRVPLQEYADLLTVRDGKENVRIWIKEQGNLISELLLLVGSPTDFVLLDLTGKIDLDKISTLSKSLDVEGAEHLEKVKGRKRNE